MTAPVATTRQTPAGVKIGDGFRTLVTFALAPTLALFEEEVTPPGFEGDDPIDNSTQHNTTLRTMAPGSLARMTDSTFTAMYDPKVWDTIVGTLINQPTTITHLYPNHDTLAAYGYLKSFIPGALSRGTKPTATVTIVYTNQDPTTCAEELPVFTEGSGTGGC